MTTLINTLTSEKGTLFTIGQGRRVPLADCRPEIRIYERINQVPVLGSAGYQEKSVRFTIALCGDMEFTHNPTKEELRKVGRYELTADLLRSDGIIERFYFHNISLMEINETGGWEFELNPDEEQMRKLMEMAGV